MSASLYVISKNDRPQRQYTPAGGPRLLLLTKFIFPVSPTQQKTAASGWRPLAVRRAASGGRPLGERRSGRSTAAVVLPLGGASSPSPQLTPRHSGRRLREICRQASRRARITGDRNCIRLVGGGAWWAVAPSIPSPSPSIWSAVAPSSPSLFLFIGMAIRNQSNVHQSGLIGGRAQRGGGRRLGGGSSPSP